MELKESLLASFQETNQLLDKIQKGVCLCVWIHELESEWVSVCGCDED